MPRLKAAVKPPPKLDDLVGYFLSVRDEIARLETEHDQQLKPLKDMRQELEERLLAALDAAGVESARTDRGTVTATIRHSANCKADPDAFMQFVIDNELFDLLERRACTVPCMDYAKEHNELPPGVTINSIRKLHITGSTHHE
jgi:hypothetical protein